MNEITLPRDGLFLCRRTSTYDDKPCDEAFEIWVPRVDRRTSDSPEKIPHYAFHGVNEWYTNGANHRVENGMICRDFPPVQYWAVETDNVMDFVRKHGECVVGINNDGYATIEIYDDYRE